MEKLFCLTGFGNQTQIINLNREIFSIYGYWKFWMRNRCQKIGSYGLSYYYHLIKNMGLCYSKTSQSKLSRQNTISSQDNTAPSFRNSQCIVQTNQKFEDIFSPHTSPVENLLIIDTMKKAAAQETNGLVTEMPEPEWRKVKYRNDRSQKSNYWGICQWKDKQDHKLNYKSCLYNNHRNYEYLVAGYFKEGEIIEKEKYYKFFSNGSYYFGTLNHGLQPHGTGQMVYENKNIYKGMFVGGIPHGYGELQTPEKHFKGSFCRGEKEKGQEIGKSGKYTGSFKDNMRDGKGCLVLFNGLEYKGNFKKNKRDGYGKLTGKDGKVIFDGKWNKDSMVK